MPKCKKSQKKDEPGSNRIISIALFVGALASAPEAHALSLRYMSGNDLYRFCTSQGTQGIGDSGALLCLGYLTALTDIASSGAAISGHKACIPAGADENQVVDIVKSFIQSHPQTRHLPAFGLVSQALSEAFPCR